MVHTAAVWDTEQYLNLGKTWKNWAEFEVKLMDGVSVSGACDQNAATICVNKWILNGARDWETAERDTCAKKAGCGTNFDSMTGVQKQALATKWDTSVNDVGTQYTNIWN